MNKKMNVYKSLNIKNSMKKPKNSFDLRIVPRHSKKKLKPYGDYDLDGSLNYYDCNPYDPSQDGALSFLAEKVGGAISKGAEKVGKVISKGAEATGKVIGRGGEEVGKGLTKGTDRGMKQVRRQMEALKEKMILRDLRKQKEKAMNKTSFSDKVDKFGSKLTGNIRKIEKGIHQQIRSPTSRVITKTYYDKKTGEPYKKKVAEQLIKSSRGKYGGMTYSTGGLSIHSSKRRLKKVRKTAYGRTTGKPGRPKGSYKPRFIPGVGYKAIPAKSYYKILRRIKSQGEGQAQATDMQQIRALAQRGIPPEQARELINQRQIQRAVINPPRVQAPPIQPPQFNPQQFQQVEQQRIQTQVERWAQPNAQRMLQRRMELEQPSQPPQQRMEVSLLDGRARPVSNSMSRRERWTY